MVYKTKWGKDNVSNCDINRPMVNRVSHNQIMSVERSGIIIVIAFECLSRLEFQLLGVSIQVTMA